MAKYFYLPRPDDELLGMIKDWNEVRDDGTEYRILKHSAIGHPLKNITPTDRLYVFGHGNLGQGIGPSKHGLSEEKLAERLKGDGLPQAHPEIRLFACNTAVTMPGFISSFAERLARELWKIGYRQMAVVGYIGFGALPSRYIKKKVTSMKHSDVDLSSDIDNASQRKISYKATEHGVFPDDNHRDHRYIGTKDENAIARDGVTTTTLWVIARYP